MLVSLMLMLLGASAVTKGAPNNGCADPIVGLWSARYHTSGMEDWHDFQLSIERVPGAPDQLTGLITVEVWNGGKALKTPPPCEGGELGSAHYVVEMRARGTLHGTRFTFDGQDLVVRERKCGGAPAYAIDHLSGTLRGDGRERWLELANDDGTRRLTRAVQFKRIRCAVVRIVE